MIFQKAFERKLKRSRIIYQIPQKKFVFKLKYLKKNERHDSTHKNYTQDDLKVTEVQ
jgi:hypothetical protein